MEGVIVGSIIFVIIAALVFVFYKKEKKKNALLQRDLNFFKREKEYYDEAMLVLDKQNRIVFANGSAKKLFSLDEHNLIPPHAKKIGLKIDTHDPKDFFEVLMEQAAQHKGSFHLQNVLLVEAGKMKQVNVYVDQTGLDKAMTCIIDMQTVAPVESKPSNKDGGIDFFTALPSQFSALSDINAMIIKSKKNADSFGVLLIGIDYFSDLQSSLGLGYTNQLIKKIANYFIENPQENMHVYRMDCDKFMILVEGMDHTENIRKIAKQLLTDMSQLLKEENNARITISIGIAIYPEHGENGSKIINHAYEALRQAQNQGDSNIEVFSLDHLALQKEDVKIAAEISHGLKNHEFFLYYQPVFNLETEEMIGAEALIRWKHPEFGIIAADKFLDIAEKTGQIVEIGEYVFREAIKQRKYWDDNGLNKFKITLNLSLKEMQVEKLIHKLEALFEDHRVDPRMFNLDITEKAAMSNIERSMVDFKLFRDFGLSISLDNFGIGSSSIKHLQMLPLSSIKIDRSLIQNIDSNLDHQITVKAMIDMIHDLGFEVIAEGVETSKESALLYDLGCDHAQGYLFSKPLPATELYDLLK